VSLAGRQRLDAVSDHRALAWVDRGDVLLDLRVEQDAQANRTRIWSVLIGLPQPSVGSATRLAISACSDEGREDSTVRLLVVSM
jgi:hypothetical protein